MSRVLRVGLVGSTGRMGKEVAAAVLKDPRFKLASGINRDCRAFILPGFAEGDVRCCSTLMEVFKSSDVVIDFSMPDCLVECLKVAESTRVPFVSGTTANDLLPLMSEVAKRAPVFWASNMSYGIAVVNKLVSSAAKALKGYDIEVFEMHHRHKKDPFSGTGLTLAETAAKAAGAQVDKETKRGPKSSDKVGFAVARGGAVFGDHEVIFASDDDVITISHRALNRSIFAKGALDAAFWLYDLVNGGKVSSGEWRLFSTADMCPDA